MKTCWEILEIEPTDDKKAIRKAYSQQVKKYHPEDDPKMYQLVRQAYQDAINFTKEDNSEFFQMDIIEPEEKIANDFTFDLTKRQRELVYQQVDQVYYGEDYNNLDLWVALLEENKDDLAHVLDRVLELGIDKLTNEQVISCLNNCTDNSSINYPNKKIFQKQYDKLRKTVSKKFVVLDAAFVLMSLVSIVIGLFLLLFSGFKAIFINNEMTLINLGMMITSFLTYLQVAKMLTRNYDGESRFYYRSCFLVFLTIIWVFIEGYYLYLGYQYFFGTISIIMILFNLVINLVMYLVMHSKKYLTTTGRQKKQPRDLSNLAIIYLIVLIFIIGAGIFYLIRVKMTRNLEYFILLTVGLAGLYSNIRALVICLKDQPQYYCLRNANALIVVNGIASICCFNLMFHYLWVELKFNDVNYLLAGLTVILALIVFGIYTFVERNRKKQYYEAFELDDHGTAVRRIYEFIFEKCNDGKNLDELTKYEKDFYLLGSLIMAIEQDLEQLYCKNGFLMTEIMRVLQMLQLNDVLIILNEANDVLFKESQYVKNDKLLYHYQFSLSKSLPSIFNQLYVFMIENKNYFVYDKIKL